MVHTDKNEGDASIKGQTEAMHKKITQRKVKKGEERRDAKRGNTTVRKIRTASRH
jgi:hypothetical protein